MLELEPSMRLPPACELYDRAISLSGMSKAFSMPGLRIGWLAMQDEALLQRVISYKDYTTICSAGLSEILALIGLRNADNVCTLQIARLSSSADKSSPISIWSYLEMSLKLPV